MTISRLGTLSADLAELMSRPDVDTNKLQRATAVACGLALLRANFHNELASAALSILDSGGVASIGLRKRLELLRNELDARYLDLRDFDRGSRAEEMTLFSQARATAAICYALAGERALLSEAIYEAAMASDDPSETVAATLKVLS